MDKQTIIEKRFTRSIEGYDIEEVDAFLDEVAREFDRRDAALNVARLRIKLLLGEMESHGLIPKRNDQNGEKEACAENEAKRETFEESVAGQTENDVPADGSSGETDSSRSAAEDAEESSGTPYKAETDQAEKK